jgi:hypothetical protein
VLEINCRFGIKNQAISISDSSMTEDTKLPLILASWGSTNRVAYIDIMSRSITIGTETMQIHSGQAHYLPYAHKVFAYMQ